MVRHVVSDVTKVDLDDLHREICYRTVVGIPPRPGVSMEQVALALIAHIRELRAGLADAMYWLKPGLAEKRAEEMARDRAELSKLLDKEIAIP